MQIKIIRGTNHIGGTITEITCDGGRIFIDLGAMLPAPGEDAHQEPNPNIEGLTCGKKSTDAVFFTHIHGDHIGLAHHILPEIPLYLDEYAINIRQVVDRYTRNPPLSFRPLYAAKSIQLGWHGGLKVTPFFTDHSSFRTSMFLIEGDGKRVLHTGDFRNHGRIGASLARTLEHYVGKVDALICEGTMLGRTDEQVLTEKELSRQAEIYMQEYNMVFALQSSTNIDRLASFYAAARKQGKLFLVDTYQYEVLQALAGTPYEWLSKEAWIFNFGMLPLIQQKGAFMPIRKSQIKLFDDLAEKLPGCMLYSQWKGYRVTDAGVVALLATATQHAYPVISIHTSGHATVEAIRMVNEVTQAKVLIPMHTEHKVRFGELFSNALILEDGEALTV